MFIKNLATNFLSYYIQKINIGLESTVISLGSTINILRPGAITAEMISKVLNKRVFEKKHKGDVVAPGQFKKHYSPGIPVYLNKQRQKKMGLYWYLVNIKSLKIFFS
jgi:Putative translation factor (SUA5)